MPLATLIAAEVCEDSNAVNQYSIRGFVRLELFLIEASFHMSDHDDYYDTLISESTGIPIRVVEDTPLETSCLSLYCALIGFRVISIPDKYHCLHQGLLLRPDNVQPGSFVRIGYFVLFRNAAASSLKLRKSQMSTWISVGILNGKKSRYVESFHCNCTELSSVLTFPHIISSRRLWPRCMLPSVVFKFGQTGLAAAIYVILRDLRIMGENSRMGNEKSPFKV
jgi:hypothetical protein